MAIWGEKVYVPALLGASGITKQQAETCFYYALPTGIALADFLNLAVTARTEEEMCPVFPHYFVISQYFARIPPPHPAGYCYNQTDEEAIRVGTQSPQKHYQPHQTNKAAPSDLGIFGHVVSQHKVLTVF
jgi:hypothetical protein